MDRKITAGEQVTVTSYLPSAQWN